MTEDLENSVSVVIGGESDVGIARIRTHRLAIDEGFSDVSAAALATAVSELARNVFVHARFGELRLHVTERDGRRGVVAIVHDEGPGIADHARAMDDGYMATPRPGASVSVCHPRSASSTSSTPQHATLEAVRRPATLSDIVDP